MWVLPRFVPAKIPAVALDGNGHGRTHLAYFSYKSRLDPDSPGRPWTVDAAFAHNHPSGVAQPSQADELLTRQLREALALVDVKVLDHFVIAGNQALSFAERDLL